MQSRASTSTTTICTGCPGSSGSTTTASRRADLLGGGRVLGFLDRLKTFRTLGQYAADQGWDFGEGFIVGKTGRRLPATHLTGKDLLPSDAIVGSNIVRAEITKVDARLFKTSYTPARYTPPMFLVREQMDLDHALWTDSYLTYKNKVVGICAQKGDLPSLKALHKWLA